MCTLAWPQLRLAPKTSGSSATTTARASRLLRPRSRRPGPDALEIEKRMYGGTVAASRDLKAMDDEVKHLARHVGDLEDREIEIMEVLEPLDQTLDQADVERKGLEESATRLRQAIAEAEVDIDAAIADQTKARLVSAQEVPADLLGRYEKLRTRLGGTGAARLVGVSCGGCHLALPAMEVDRIRKAPPDAVITCDQCGRILVR